MSIQNALTFEVFPDDAYHFEIRIGDEIALSYMQDNPSTGVRESRDTIHFGSLNEVEAVAQAMLRAVRAARD